MYRCDQVKIIVYYGSEVQNLPFTNFVVVSAVVCVCATVCGVLVVVCRLSALAVGG